MTRHQCFVKLIGLKQHGQTLENGKPVQLTQEAFDTAHHVMAIPGQPFLRNDGGVDIMWLCEVPELGPGLHEINLQIAPNGDTRTE